MKFILLSDTHGYYPTIPKGDVLLFAGDWSSNRGSLRQTKLFAEYIGDAPCARKIVIAGNHDIPMKDYEGLCRQTFYQHGVHYLQDQGLYVGGVDNYPGLYIYGSPWSPKTLNPWAFDLDRRDMAMVRALIPDYTDILVTHGPPMGTLDRTDSNEQAGDGALLDKIKEIKPLMNVFGHIHEGYGSVKKGDTIFVNAAFVDVTYHPKNEPIEMEIPYVTDR